MTRDLPSARLAASLLFVLASTMPAQPGLQWVRKDLMTPRYGFAMAEDTGASAW